MFPVVAEVITGQQGECSRQGQAAGVMAIGGLEHPVAVGQIGAEHEQLQRTEQQRQDPEQQQIGQGMGREPLQHQGAGQPAAEQASHLHGRQILRHEAQIPGQSTAMPAIVMVGIPGAGGIQVVAQVVAPAPLPGQPGIEHQGQVAEPVVPAPGAGQQRTVHGVMGDDEQPRLQEGPQQHRQGQQQRRRGAIAGKQHGGAERPTAHDRQRKPQSPQGELGHQSLSRLAEASNQRANLSSSAAEASRSMATK